jgi:RNA polymerase sigma-70 factor (ECF subfamily)
MGYTPLVQVGVDGQIRDCLARGDRHGAASLAVRGYGPSILGYLRSVVRDETAAADAFSQFCEFLWKQLHQYRGEAAFSTWLYHLAWGAVRRQLEDPYQRRGRRLETSELHALAQQVLSSTTRILDEAEARLEALRAQLTPEEQTLLILRVDRDLAWRDIAVVLGGSEPALRKRYERLKEKVRRLAAAAPRAAR